MPQSFLARTQPGSRVKQKTASLRSGSLAAVVAQHSAQARATDDSPSGRAFRGTGVDQLAAKALVMQFSVVMSQVLPKRPAEVILAERNHAVQALPADREHEALGISVQVWAASGEPDHAQAAAFEQGPKLGRKERVAVQNQKALAQQEKAAQAPPRPATRSSPGRAAPRASAERSGRLPAAALGGRRRDLEPAPHPRGGLSVAKLCTQCTKKEPLVT